MYRSEEEGAHVGKGQVRRLYRYCHACRRLRTCLGQIVDSSNVCFIYLVFIGSGRQSGLNFLAPPMTSFAAPIVVVPFCVGIGVLCFFILVEWKVAKLPIVPLAIFRNIPVV
jgi:hypothetical protein